MVIPLSRRENIRIVLQEKLIDNGDGWEKQERVIGCIL